MTLSNIVNSIGGKIVCGKSNSNTYKYCFASDLMSDVLRVDSDELILLTGLANTQSIRTAEMADIDCIILARNKQPTQEMIALACENNITIIESPLSMFHIAGLLFQNKIKPLF